MLKGDGNGVAWLQRKESWRENAPWVDMEVRANISAKRVSTSFMVFDRTTGKRISAFNPHLKPRRLVAYQPTGGTKVTFVRD